MESDLSRFQPFQRVRVIDGPFTDFVAKVKSVDFEHQKLRLLMSVSRRDEAVALEFAQVRPLES